jgi:hypothetical protein
MGKRVVTSAIDGMSVGEVRKNLDVVRKRWKQQNSETPFFITDPVANGLTVETFAFKFLLGHHFKRHQKKAVEGEAGAIPSLSPPNSAHQP